MSIEQRQRIVAVEMATERAWGVPVAAVQDERLRGQLTNDARSLIEMQRQLGADFVDGLDVHVYGPLPSEMDVEALLTGQVDESHYHSVVDACVALGGYGFYVLNADFNVRSRGTGARALIGATT